MKPSAYSPCFVRLVSVGPPGNYEDGGEVCGVFKIVHAKDNVASCLFKISGFNLPGAKIQIRSDEDGKPLIIEFCIGVDPKKYGFTEGQTELFKQFMTAYHGWMGHIQGILIGDLIPFPLPQEMKAGGGGSRELVRLLSIQELPKAA